MHYCFQISIYVIIPFEIEETPKAFNSMTVMVLKMNQQPEESKNTM